MNGEHLHKVQMNSANEERKRTEKHDTTRKGEQQHRKAPPKRSGPSGSSLLCEKGARSGDLLSTLAGVALAAAKKQRREPPDHTVRKTEKQVTALAQERALPRGPIEKSTRAASALGLFLPCKMHWSTAESQCISFLFFSSLKYSWSDFEREQRWNGCAPIPPQNKRVITNVTFSSTEVYRFVSLRGKAISSSVLSFQFYFLVSETASEVKFNPAFRLSAIHFP